MMSLNKAIKIAKRSPQKRFLTGACISAEDELINGWSHISNLRMSSTHSLHAEMHALGRARHLDLRGSTIYVANISRKSGNIALAKPCVSCSIALAAAGVREAVYTIDAHTYGVLDLNGDLSGLKLYKRRK